MEQSTKLALMRLYARMSDDELVRAKADIGELLKHTKVKNMDDIKVNIALINDEIKTRLQRHP